MSSGSRISQLPGELQGEEFRHGLRTKFGVALRGNVVKDVSFRVVKTAQYSNLKARIRNGVVETQQADVRMPEFSWGETNRGDALFQKGRVRLVLNKDGGLSGLVGGYRDWRDVYGRDTFNVPSGGATIGGDVGETFHPPIATIIRPG